VGTQARRKAALALLLVLAVGGLAACSDDDTSEDGASSDDSAVEASSSGECPFDADELSDATGIAMEDAAPPDGAPDTLRCVFVQEGKDLNDITSFTIASVDLPDSEPLADLHVGFAAQGNTEDLPELGEDAFVRTSTVTGGVDQEELHEAVVTYQDGDVVTTVVLAGVLPEDQVATATAGVVELLSD
jgi:hypothetical protein